MPHQLVWWFMMPPIVLVSYSSPTADKITSDPGTCMPLGPVPPSSHRLASSLTTLEILKSRFSRSYDLEYFSPPKLCWKPKAQDEYLGVRSLEVDLAKSLHEWDYPQLKKKIHIVALRGRRKPCCWGWVQGLPAMDVECYQMIFLYFFRWLYNFSCLFYKYRELYWLNFNIKSNLHNHH